MTPEEREKAKRTYENAIDQSWIRLLSKIVTGEGDLTLSSNERRLLVMKLKTCVDIEPLVSAFSGILNMTLAAWEKARVGE